MYLKILEYATNSILIALLVLSCYKDIKNNTIPNKYTIPSLVLGLLLMTLQGGFSGLKDSLLGFLLGFGLFFIPFVFGLMGAGDLKLMAAIGALKGLAFTWNSIIYSGIAGGLVVVVYVIYKKRLLNTIVNMFGLIIRPFAKALYLNAGNKTAKRLYEYFEIKRIKYPELYIPYALPIAIGTLAVLFGGVFNLI